MSEHQSTHSTDNFCEPCREGACTTTSATHDPSCTCTTDVHRALAQSERLAWLPVELVERHATRWALAEGIVDVDDVPELDPDRGRFEQLRDFQEWARQNVWDHWQTEQVRRGVPLACPPWCEGRHYELLVEGLILPWDMSITHESVQLAPEGCALDVRIVQLQSHPDDNPDPGAVALHIGGEAVLATPADVRALAVALADAADDFEAVQ